MLWKPRNEEVFQVERSEKDLYESRDVASAYSAFQWSHRIGIHTRGEFPVAVVRKRYAERGYDSWISAQSKHGVTTYLLERLPGKRRQKDPAYLKMVEVFGDELLDEFHQLAAAERLKNAFRAAGGDPDLFVQGRGDPTDRFFVEVKLEDLTGGRPYRDEPNRQQLVLFPLIEKKLQCEVRLARVCVRAG